MQRASRDALPVSKCVDLLNYYLGFDGWRTRIVEVCREPLQGKEIAMCSTVCSRVMGIRARQVGVTDRIPPSGLAGLADLSAIIRAHVVVELPEKGTGVLAPGN